MSYEQDAKPSLDTLSAHERAVLEYYAEGLDGYEIAVRLRMSEQEISVVRFSAARKLALRMATAHPFQIHEVVLD